MSMIEYFTEIKNQNISYTVKSFTSIVKKPARRWCYQQYLSEMQRQAKPSVSEGWEPDGPYLSRGDHDLEVV